MFEVLARGRRSNQHYHQQKQKGGLAVSRFLDLSGGVTAPATVIAFSLRFARNANLKLNEAPEDIPLITVGYIRLGLSFVLEKLSTSYLIKVLSFAYTHG